MKTSVRALATLLFFTLLTGLVYTGAVTGVSAVAFNRQANGSLVVSGGRVVGSELIAQNFKGPGYFWPRPSAADFNPLPSGGSNYAPSSAELLGKIKERKKLGMTRDLLFASASGLDPHISPEAAFDQIERIASARGLRDNQLSAVRALILRHVEERQYGMLGEGRVNVLRLNLALDEETRIAK
ncbi:MAG: potassium-transporting ATPase subunit KdpC [Nitrospinae bacterium]|nr:potassium-transporting ATPase subunit KdpC [Nitrospinota bacterium]